MALNALELPSTNDSEPKVGAGTPQPLLKEVLRKILQGRGGLNKYMFDVKLYILTAAEFRACCSGMGSCFRISLLLLRQGTEWGDISHDGGQKQMKTSCVKQLHAAKRGRFCCQTPPWGGL